MPILEVRRHTMRAKPGQHLSQDGVSLAQHIGRALGPFDLVVTSELPRAIETAIAMGFSVDRYVADLGILPDIVLAALAWPNSLTAISKILEEDQNCLRFAQQQAELWRDIFDQLSDDQSALIITHGGIIELGALGFLPDGTPNNLGDAIGYCEGFRFTKQGETFTCEALQVDENLRLVHN